MALQPWGVNSARNDQVFWCKNTCDFLEALNKTDEYVLIFFTLSSCFRDKAVSEEEYNEKNKHHFLPEESYRVHSLSSAETRFDAALGT